MCTRNSSVVLIPAVTPKQCYRSVCDTQRTTTSVESSATSPSTIIVSITFSPFPTNQPTTAKNTNDKHEQRAATSPQQTRTEDILCNAELPCLPLRSVSVSISVSISVHYSALVSSPPITQPAFEPLWHGPAVVAYPIVVM
ncbi:uncharacterized protein YALI1_B23447g [Yarrowia lipolytica]|uniref:Uncharacterized protein n=1 Tax=Yarrowia lipolytica TaxID=4952 RepID=A0A1D8N8D9_YARLL|nr:hypothetical protein YALI1_B23447g [Yarrowia lipolytica]